VAAADRDRFAGNRDVKRLGDEPLGQLRLGDDGRARLNGALDVGPDLIGQLSDDGTLLRAEPSHLLEDGRNPALLAEEFHACLLESGAVGGAFYSGQCRGFELFQLFLHMNPPFRITLLLLQFYTPG
jgi:hypothetical protein